MNADPARPRRILEAAEMRAAEQRAIADGTNVDELMQRAGTAVATAAIRYVGLVDTLVLCGPGNNGGDGYLVARLLAEAGAHVRVAACAPPLTDAATRARAAWGGEIERLHNAEPAPLLIDALFGTGLSRGLDPDDFASLSALADAARTCIAIDLPSGVASDDGQLLSPVPAFDLTVALGALKPAHLLQPAAALMGRLVVADIGVVAPSRLTEVARPVLPAPGPCDHKYTRGLVTVVGGAMPGAAHLAALGAARAGAGYVRLLGGTQRFGLPAAIVVEDSVTTDLSDPPIGAIVVGPGLGRDTAAAASIADALASGRPLVLDADALAHLGSARITVPAILTPHEGEFARLFGDVSGSKVARARAAAQRSGVVVLLKGADTVIAAPDGRASIAAAASHELATAGSGDVLAGICGTMLAQLGDPFAAACAAAWLHAAAAHALLGPFVADDLPAALGAQVASCR